LKPATAEEDVLDEVVELVDVVLEVVEVLEVEWVVVELVVGVV
jgi:hypothetical protein